MKMCLMEKQQLYVWAANETFRRCVSRQLLVKTSKLEKLQGALAKGLIK